MTTGTDISTPETQPRSARAHIPGYERMNFFLECSVEGVPAEFTMNQTQVFLAVVGQPTRVADIPAVAQEGVGLQRIVHFADAAVVVTFDCDHSVNRFERVLGVRHEMARIQAPASLSTPGAAWNGQPASGALPGVGLTVVITVLFGLFGIIPAFMHTDRARSVGVSTTKYWVAFGWSLLASVAISVFFVLALVAAVGASI